jgi:predicted DNA-binding transcriptional regulator AlpA
MILSIKEISKMEGMGKVTVYRLLSFVWSKNLEKSPPTFSYSLLVWSRLKTEEWAKLIVK